MTVATNVISEVEEEVVATAPAAPTKPKGRPKKTDNTNLSTNAETDIDQTETAEPVIKNKKRPREIISQPFFEQKLIVQSVQAQRVMDRTFKALSGSLFRTEVILRIVGDETRIDELEQLIIDALKNVTEELQEEITQAKQLITNNGIDIEPQYSKSVSYDIKIKTPQIANFARMVVQLDDLMGMIDTLWLLGAGITSKQRSRSVFEWQQRLIRLGNQIISHEKRARDFAYRAGKQEDVDREAPIHEQDADEKLLLDGDDSSAAEDKELEDTTA